MLCRRRRRCLSNRDRIAGTGAAGVSIEDYDPGSGIDPVDIAVERVAAAAEVTRSHGMVLTARAENHLYGIEDLDDTIARLSAIARPELTSFMRHGWPTSARSQGSYPRPRPR